MCVIPGGATQNLQKFHQLFEEGVVNPLLGPGGVEAVEEGNARRIVWQIVKILLTLKVETAQT